VNKAFPDDQRGDRDMARDGHQPEVLTTRLEDDPLWVRILSEAARRHRGATWSVGLDLGASGSRLRAVREGADPVDVVLEDAHPALVACKGGSNATAVVRALAERLHETLDEQGAGSPFVSAAAVGVRGLQSLRRSGALDPVALHATLALELGALHTVVASDAVTAHLGAMRGRSGVTLAVGTGVVAASTDGEGRLRVADGIGPLVGDNGGGTWIGEEGMRSAAREAYGSRRMGSPMLLDLAQKQFGPPRTWEFVLAEAGDRPRRLAAFAPVVLEAAQAGDRIASGIVDRAAELLADTVIASLAYPRMRQVVAVTGGLMSDGGLLRTALKAVVVSETGLPLQTAEGNPVDGAIALAEQVVQGELVFDAPAWVTVEHHFTAPKDRPDNVIPMNERSTPVIPPDADDDLPGAGPTWAERGRT
jgi:N-acetylglucosamine kinase-like BadF-type ATPase